MFFDTPLSRFQNNVYTVVIETMITTFILFYIYYSFIEETKDHAFFYATCVPATIYARLTGTLYPNSIPTTAEEACMITAAVTMRSEKARSSFGNDRVTSTSV